MPDAPCPEELSKYVGGELGSSVGQEYVRGCCAAKMVSQCGGKLCGCGIFAHFDDIRPVSLAINEDEELLVAI